MSLQVGVCYPLRNGLDHFVKEQLKARQYLRYVDDFALFSDDRLYLEEARLAIEEYLINLRLRLHPVKSRMFETRYGANFVGFRVLPHQVRVRGGNLKRARSRLRELQQTYRAGQISLADLMQRLQSWEAHLRHGDTYRLCRQIFDTWSFTPPSEPLSMKIPLLFEVEWEI